MSRVKEPDVPAEEMLMQSVHFHCDFIADLLGLDDDVIVRTLRNLAEWYGDRPVHISLVSDEPEYAEAP